MKIKSIIVLAMIIASIFFSLNISNAEENEYGYCEAWIMLEGEDWQKTPVTNVSLDIYEPFYLKATYESKIECYFSSEIEGAGTTKTFEVLEGPSGYEETLSHGGDQVEPGWNQTYTWKIRPTNNKFAGGKTPLKLHVQFTKQEKDEYTGLWDYDYNYFTMNIISPHINNQIWEGYEEGDDQTDDNDENKDTEKTDKDKSTSGFEIVIFILSISILLIALKKRKKS